MNWVSAHAAPPINSLQINYLQVLNQSHLITVSKYITKLAPLQGQRALLSSLDHGLHDHLPTCFIMASKCISKLTQLQIQSASLSSRNLVYQLHLHTCMITASECISEVTGMSSSGAPKIALKRCLQPVQIYRVYMGSCIDIQIHSWE